MRLTPCKTCLKIRSGLSGVGITEFLAPIAGAMFGGGSGSGGSSAPASAPITVSPSIQVSPQISPIFQQQFQPSNSPISAGTSQSLPAMPSPMGPSSFDTGAGYPPPSYGMTPVNTSIPMPAVNTPPQDWSKYVPWAIGGMIALFAIKTYGGKKGEK